MAHARTSRATASLVGRTDDREFQLRKPEPGHGLERVHLQSDGAGWTFSGNAGIEANGSAWNAPAAPDGTQAAFLQSGGAGGSYANGFITQTLNFTSTGVYELEFAAAQRAGNATTQETAVYLDNTLLGVYTPASSSSWSSFAVGLQINTVGNHTLVIEANVDSGDETNFVDNVQIVAATAPAVATAAAANPNPASGNLVNLSVLGADQTGESNLTYTWATTGSPPGTVSFEIANGTNASKNIEATFSRPASTTCR